MVLGGRGKEMVTEKEMFERLMEGRQRCEHSDWVYGLVVL